MSPILYVALLDHRDRLQQLGHKIEGEAPVLVVEKKPFITPTAISSNHWPAIAAKAGFVDKDGDLRHTFYALRHTAANIWRAVGVPELDLCA